MSWRALFERSELVRPPQGGCRPRGIVGHGGHISVSSVMGKGTTFTILLPRLDVVLPAHIDETEEWPKGSGRVLFVNDVEMLAEGKNNC